MYTESSLASIDDVQQQHMTSDQKLVEAPERLKLLTAKLNNVNITDHGLCQTCQNNVNVNSAKISSDRRRSNQITHTQKLNFTNPNKYILKVATFAKQGNGWQCNELETRQSGQKNAGFGVFAKQDISAGFCIPIIGHYVSPIQNEAGSAYTWSLQGGNRKNVLKRILDGDPNWKPFHKVGTRGLSIAMMVNELSSTKQKAADYNCHFYRQNIWVTSAVPKNTELFVYYGKKYNRDYNVIVNDKGQKITPEFDQWVKQQSNMNGTITAVTKQTKQLEQSLSAEYGAPYKAWIPSQSDIGKAIERMTNGIVFCRCPTYTRASDLYLYWLCLYIIALEVYHFWRHNTALRKDGATCIAEYQEQTRTTHDEEAKQDDGGSASYVEEDNEELEQEIEHPINSSLMKMNIEKYCISSSSIRIMKMQFQFMDALNEEQLQQMYEPFKD